MEEHCLHTAVENLLDIVFLKHCLTVENHVVALDRHNFAGILVDKVLDPRTQHACGKFAAHRLLEVCLVDLDLFGQIENFNDVLVAFKTDGTQQSSHGQFFLTVDVSVHHIVDVGGELNPRAAERNDAGRIELGAVGMGALSEKHTWRTVKLRHDNALGAVDDKGSLVSHVRDRAEIHVLNHRVKVFVIRVCAIKLQFGLEGHAVGETACETLFNRVARRIDIIVEKLQDKIISCVRNREVLGKHLEEALVVALFRRGVQLQEVMERLQLHLEKIGVGQRIFHRREVDARLLFVN